MHILYPKQQLSYEFTLIEGFSTKYLVSNTEGQNPFYFTRRRQN